MTEKEIQLAEKAAKAMAINFNARSVKVKFFNTLQELKEHFR